MATEILAPNKRVEPLKGGSDSPKVLDLDKAWEIFEKYYKDPEGKGKESYDNMPPEVKSALNLILNTPLTYRLKP